MNFKVGDRVRVRTWESLYAEFGDPDSSNHLKIRKGFNDEMRNLCGTVVTISYVYEDSYSIKEAGWIWTDDMLMDCVVEEEEKPKVKRIMRLSEIPDGRKFDVAGIKMFKLQRKSAGWMCVYANPVFESAYETSQNYAKSTIHRRLTEEVLPVLVEKIGDDNLLEFTLDLRHENDRNKYLDIQTKIGIIPYHTFCDYKGSGLAASKRSGFMFATGYRDESVLYYGMFGADTCSINTEKNIIPIVCLADDLEVTYEG